MLESRRRVVVGDDGRIVVGTTQLHEDGRTDPLLFELSASGEVNARWHPPPDQYAARMLADVRLDHVGRLYVAARGSNRTDTVESPSIEWLGRWSPTGAFLGAWVQEYYNAAAVEVDPRDGGALVLGFDTTVDGYSRPVLRRYDADGDVLWTRILDVAGEEHLAPYELATACDGLSLVVAGRTPEVAPEFPFWLFMVDDDGNEVERRTLTTDPAVFRVEDLATDAFGNAVITGQQYDPDTFIVGALAR